MLCSGLVDDFGPPDSILGDLDERGELLESYLAEGEGDRTAVYRSGALSDLPRYGGRQFYGNAG